MIPIGDVDRMDIGTSSSKLSCPTAGVAELIKNGLALSIFQTIGLFLPSNFFTIIMNMGTKLEKESNTSWDIVPTEVMESRRTFPLKLINLKTERRVNQRRRTR